MQLSHGGCLIAFGEGQGRDADIGQLFWLRAAFVICFLDVEIGSNRKANDD